MNCGKMVALYGLLVLKVLCVIVNSENIADPSLVTAIAGYPALIPCNLSTPLVDDEASLIMWYRSDLPNPIYTLDLRYGPTARHFPALELEGRAYFNVSVHPPLLMVDPVNGADEADYRCRVDLKRSRTLILHSRLDVIVPPGEPIIMDEHGQHLHDIIGPYDEGTTLRFICEVDGGDPPPEVSWWRGDKLVGDTFNSTGQTFVRNDMVLYNIQRRDWMAEFKCKASNTNETMAKEASLQVDINLTPLEVKIVNPKNPMLAGEEQSIECETRGSRPKALTSWWLEGEELPQFDTEDEFEDENITVSILKFTPGPEDDGKKLTCKSYNPILPKKVLEDQTTLDVQYLPILNLTLVPKVSENGVKEGSDVYLECNLMANPGVYNFTWEFEERLLKLNTSFGIVILNHTLLLQKVRKEHQGKYRCYATNALGTGTSNFLYLTVQFAPICKSPRPTYRGTSIAETVNLTCEVEASPRELEFQWHFNGSMEVDETRNWITETNASTLQYILKTELGYGTFYCWGTNAIGTQKKPCVFKVIPAGPPEPLQDCKVTNRSSDSLSVECNPGYNGSITQNFHLEVYNSVDESMAENVTNDAIPYFDVAGLSSSTSYVLVIYSSNAKGRSKSLAIVAATLSPARKRIAQEIQTSLNPIIGAIVGIVLIFVIGCIVIICVKKSRSKRKDYKKEAKSRRRNWKKAKTPVGKGPILFRFRRIQKCFIWMDTWKMFIE